MRLLVDEVHLWSASVENWTGAAYDFLSAMLDESETTRAKRFYFERDRHRFSVARGILRVLVARYVGVEPGEVKFEYSERGKPFLTYPDTDLRFNLSHSDGHAVFAFVVGREVGVDVEAGARLGDDWAAIARRYFSKREQSELYSMPASSRRAAFLRGWARKEAYLKATGLGIVDGLQGIEVSLDADHAPVFLLAEIAGRWSFCNLGAEAVATPAKALVVERRTRDEPPLILRCFSCEQDLPLPKMYRL